MCPTCNPKNTTYYWFFQRKQDLNQGRRFLCFSMSLMSLQVPVYLVLFSKLLFSCMTTVKHKFVHEPSVNPLSENISCHFYLPPKRKKRAPPLPNFPSQTKLRKSPPLPGSSPSSPSSPSDASGRRPLLRAAPSQRGPSSAVNTPRRDEKRERERDEEGCLVILDITIY